jgi:hypothetical protein
MNWTYFWIALVLVLIVFGLGIHLGRLMEKADQKVSRARRADFEGPRPPKPQKPPKAPTAETGVKPPKRPRVRGRDY